jgi:hypothetical protein
MSKRKNSVRSLATIVGEIRGTMRNDVANIIKRGTLLQEAKDQFEHGQWLPWLQDNLGMEERSAQRAMAAAKFAAKFDNLSDLQLSKSALYELSAGDEYPPKVIKAVLKEAKSKLVDAQRVYDIDAELNPPPRVPETDDLPKRPPEADAPAPAPAPAPSWAEAEKILDGPPPNCRRPYRRNRRCRSFWLSSTPPLSRLANCRPNR